MDWFKDVIQTVFGGGSVDGPKERLCAKAEACIRQFESTADQLEEINEELEEIYEEKNRLRDQLLNEMADISDAILRNQRVVEKIRSLVS